MSSTSPFCIPHIVHSICDYLLLDDIVSCKRVCKAWSEVFAPHEWRSLDLLRHSPSPEGCNLILEHAHHIESLTIHHDAFWLLESSRINVQRLSFLHAICFQVPCCHDLFSKQTSVLQNLSPWTELWLSYPGQLWGKPDTSNDPVVLARALSKCPPRVESLCVSYDFPWSGDAAADSSSSPPRRDPFTFILPWKPLSLRKFHFMCDSNCSFGSLVHIGLIPFFRNSCPLLEDLSLPSFPEETCETLMKTLGAHCPKLQYLRLNMEGTLESRFGMEVDHFGYITQALKFLKIDLNYRHDTCVLEPLRRNGSDALEALELENTDYYNSEYIPPYDWFPNLKRVDYICSHRGGREDVWTRPLESNEKDDSRRERVREEYTAMVNM